MTLDCFALRLFSFVFRTIKGALTLSGHPLRPLFLGRTRAENPQIQIFAARAHEPKPKSVKVFNLWP